MLGLFKTKPIVEKKPSYTKEGETLFWLLQEKDDWSLHKERNNYVSFPDSTTFISHSKLGIRIECYVSGFLRVKASAYDDVCAINSKLFTQDDARRITVLADEIANYLKEKPIRDKLLSVSRPATFCE
jgi:hypothetical protein